MAEKFVSEHPVGGESSSLDALHCDNMAALLVVMNTTFNGKRRHIRLDIK